MTSFPADQLHLPQAALGTNLDAFVRWVVDSHHRNTCFHLSSLAMSLGKHTRICWASSSPTLPKHLFAFLPQPPPSKTIDQGMLCRVGTPTYLCNVLQWCSSQVPPCSKQRHPGIAPTFPISAVDLHHPIQYLSWFSSRSPSTYVPSVEDW
jgi:hypothetical protein